MKILIVNNDRKESDQLMAILKKIRSQFDFYWVQDEGEAMYVLKNNKFDAVMLDYFPSTAANLYMGIDKYSGLDAAKKIRKFYPSIKILLFSKVGVSDLAAFEKSGIDANALDAVIKLDIFEFVEERQKAMKMWQAFEEFFKTLEN